MWIYNKNNQLLNADTVQCFSIVKGKSYYDDDAVLQTYYYICADGKKFIKSSNFECAYAEIESIKAGIVNKMSLYEAQGIKLNEDENGNLID